MYVCVTVVSQAKGNVSISGIDLTDWKVKNPLKARERGTYLCLASMVISLTL